MKISITKNFIKKCLIILFWLIVWQAVAVVVNNSIVIVGPIAVIKALVKNIVTLTFVNSVAGSLGRISLGFAAAFLLGITVAAFAYRVRMVEEILAPLVSAIKSVPVASFVVLLLLWAGSANLAFFITLLIVFPNIYINILEGLKNTDKKMLQMADVYEFGTIRRLKYIYRYSVMPYIKSALKVSLGMAWKSGVAAEVIGLPANSIGERIYSSKIYLDTAELFAWTLTVIFLSFLMEKIILYIVDKSSDIAFPVRITRSFKEYATKDIKLENISAGYGDKNIISDMNIFLKKGEIYCIMGPSGCGKTTLLKEIYRRCGKKCSVMFQENRLIEDSDAISNICLGSNSFDEKEVIDIAQKLLDRERLKDKVSSFSGGMKRRVALLRALVRKADVILLDEPFTGLDEEIKNKSIELITAMSKNSTVVLVTHDEEDAHKMGGNIIWMKE